jgi:uncharacterized damage-inducible protein DinB
MVASADRSNRSTTLSPAELLYGDFAAEHAVTRRFLERYPDGKGDWRPHERSRTLAHLATHVADIVNRGTAVITTDGMEIGARRPLTPVDSSRELLALFEEGAQRFSAALATTDLDHLAQPWAIHREGRTLMEYPRRLMIRQIMMSHLVHHRAQLGVYYRLLGIPVPGSYGPSADD